MVVRVKVRMKGTYALDCGSVSRAGRSALPFLLAASACAETLYNGVVLPSTWPPKVSVTHEPQDAPPYLVEPPDVIPIDVGRQLFVDYFLIEDTTLRRTFHRPQYW